MGSTVAPRAWSLWRLMTAFDVRPIAAALRLLTIAAASWGASSRLARTTTPKTPRITSAKLSSSTAPTTPRSSWATSAAGANTSGSLDTTTAATDVPTTAYSDYDELTASADYSRTENLSATASAASSADSTNGSEGMASIVAAAVCTVAAALIIGFVLTYLWRRKLLVLHAPKRCLGRLATAPNGVCSDAGRGSPSGDEPCYVNTLGGLGDPPDTRIGATTRNATHERHEQRDGAQDEYFVVEAVAQDIYSLVEPPEQVDLSKHDRNNYAPQLERDADEAATVRYASSAALVPDDVPMTTNPLYGDLACQL